jgi:ribosomal protein L29
MGTAQERLALPTRKLHHPHRIKAVKKVISNLLTFLAVLAAADVRGKFVLS